MDSSPLDPRWVEGAIEALEAAAAGFDHDADHLWTGAEVAEALRRGARNADALAGEFRP